MKKFFVFFLLLLICVNPAYAKTYYGEYGEYTEYSEEKMQTSDVIKEESKNFYHAYKEDITYEYLDNSSYEKTGKYIMNYSPWTNDKSSLDLNYDVEQCEIYTYKPYKELYYFYLKNLGEKAHITKMSAYDTKSGKLLMTNNNFYLYKNDKLVFYIDDNYSLANLRIELEVDKESSSYYYFDLKASLDLNENEISVLVKSDLSSERYVSVVMDDFKTAEGLFEDTTLKSFCNSEVDGKIINTSSTYRNVFFKYEYRVISKNYTNLYLPSETIDYKLDYSDYKTYYRYKMRDKVVLKDDLNIDEKNISLDDFILESTVDDIKITSNLNLNINGIYNINFILPFKTVSTTVKVNIIENYLNALKLQEEYVDYLLDTAETANYSVDQKNLEIKENISDSTEEINNLKEEINNYKLKIEQLEEKQDITEENDVSKQSINIFLILLCLTIIYIIDKIVEKKIVKK